MLWNCRFEAENMARKKIPGQGHDRVTRTIDYSHVRKHQRSTPKRKKCERIKK